MAQRVLGIDLGAHTVKVAELDVGFRAAKLRSLRTFDVVRGLSSSLQASLAALKEVGVLELGTGIAVGIPGDRVLLRVLDIPFADPRKISAVVGNELADELPWEIEEAIFDFVYLPLAQGKVVAAIAQRSEIKELIAGLLAVEMEPRQLPVAPLTYGALVRRIYPMSTVVVIDAGHLRTNVCLVHQGRSLLARTIFRAGHQITEAIQDKYQLTYAEAEAMKESQALVPSDLGLVGPDQQKLALVTVEVLAPLVRDLRQTLLVFSARMGVNPERVLLCGGTSLLTGFDNYLQQQLELPVEKLGVSSDAELHTAEVNSSAEGEAIGVLSLCLGLDYGRRLDIDLCQGEFSFQRDVSVFRDKAWSILISVVLVLAFVALSVYASLHSLRKEEEVLIKALRQATQQVLGKEVINAKMASKEVKKGAREARAAIPSQTAFDILDLISQKIPKADKVKLDVSRLDIKQGKTYLTGTADSRSAVDEIVKALKEEKCFTEISSGKISEVAEEKKQFSLTITTNPNVCF
ncbi:MAG: pilus assembly protein PilM [Pseudomonadota bacterium]